MRRGQRRRLTVGLVLLALLIPSLLGLDVLLRGASGLPDDPSRSPSLPGGTGIELGGVSGPAAHTSTFAFTHDDESDSSLLTSDSWELYAGILGELSLQPIPTGAGSGSGTSAIGLGFDGGVTTDGGSGSPGSQGPGGSGLPDGAGPLVSVWPPVTGSGSGGPFWGGGGQVGSGGSGPGGPGGTGGSGPSGAGPSGGAGGFGGPTGGIDQPDPVIAGTNPGGNNNDDPNHAADPEGTATVPGPPAITLVAAGIGMLWCLTKVGRIRDPLGKRSPAIGGGRI